MFLFSHSPQSLKCTIGDICQRSALLVQCRAVAAFIAGADVRQLAGATRGQKRSAKARQLAIYLAHVCHGLEISALQAGFLRDRATLRHACAQLEDRRDNPCFDAALNALEVALRAHAAAFATTACLPPLIVCFSQGSSDMPNISAKPSPRVPVSPATIDKALLALAGEGASGCLREIGTTEQMVVSARKKGISMPVLTTSAQVAGALLDAGMAQWDAAGKSGTRRLHLTPTGKARAARLTDSASHNGFMAQHCDIAQRTFEGTVHPVAFDESESPLAWLARRKGRDGRALIDPVSFVAGERFRADVTLAQMLPRVTANWSAVAGRAHGGGAGMVFSDIVMAARQRIDLALDATGPELSGVLIDVCGFLKGLELIERERNWPQRSAKVVLELGLQRLARHYGMAMEARGPDRARGIGQWGAPDFRPTISTYESTS